MKTVTYKGFSITHDESVVNVSKPNIAAEDFDRELQEAHTILSRFIMSRPGSVWGCDGIGYSIQKELGAVVVKKSGVGPRKFAEGLKELLR